jgi:hypothetical protein
MISSRLFVRTILRAVFSRRSTSSLDCAGHLPKLRLVNQRCSVIVSGLPGGCFRKEEQTDERQKDFDETYRRF